MFIKPLLTKNRTTVIYALVVLLSLGGLWFAYQSVSATPYGKMIRSLHVAPKASSSSASLKEVVDHYFKPATPEQLVASINQYRQDQGLSPFEEDASVCQTTSFEDPFNISESQVFKACADCSHTAVVTIENKASSEIIAAQLETDDTSSEILQSTQLTHLCVKENSDTFSLLFTAYQPMQALRPTPAPEPTPIPQAIKNFTEQEIWDAYVGYRRAQKRSDITFNENLCVYARKRVEEHIENFKTKPKEEYPVIEKYPLDAHAGFSRDAASGEAFQITGMQELAENLAFWPTAQSPVHVIEWGWDTSTEGHREAQLSDKYTQGCISGRNGFYVAIFGR